MCQKVGYTFGLDHQDETFTNANLNTCMDYTNDPSTNQHPNQHDYGELETITPIWTPTTIGQTISRIRRPCRTSALKASGQWGTLVKQSRDGGTEVYELDFGHDHKVFTFVTWTLDALTSVGITSRRDDSARGMRACAWAYLAGARAGQRYRSYTRYLSHRTTVPSVVRWQQQTALWDDAPHR